MLKKKAKYNVAIAGATGAVGVEFLNVLAKRNFSIENLKLLASKKSVGKKIVFENKTYTVEELTENSFKDCDIALFSAGGAQSKKFVPAAVAAGAVVIDNSSAFRMDPKVPLVIPEVNPEAAFKHQGVIANPNCTTIIMLTAIFPIHQINPIKKIVVSSYQAVSGAGLVTLPIRDGARATLTARDVFVREVRSSTRWRASRTGPPGRRAIWSPRS
jgi:aspartate-semialdehyde dehydrogenase